MHPVEASGDGRAFSWAVELPPERLEAIREGEALESPPFSVGPDSRARFQFYPKGDAGSSGKGACSLWLWTEAHELRQISLRVGEERRQGGASDFCPLQDALRNGSLQVGLELSQQEAADVTGDDPKAVDQASVPSVQQSLHLTGLEVAEWQVFNIRRVVESGELVTSAPFRFHHVLLGDMYLELQPGVPHPEHCTVFFRCRVPTMRLRVGVAVGEAFSKSFIAQGRSTRDADTNMGSCLGVNLSAPGALRPDGSLTVRCTLEEVVQIPTTLRDLIPKLDERAHWPKRL